MENINTFIIKNFNENIRYFQEKHPDIFKKISAFDDAVASGHYVEKYKLVHENDGFDVVENSTNKYLYSKNINKHTDISSKSVNKNLDNNLFQGFVDLSFTQEELSEFHKLRKSTPFKSYLSYVTPITQFIKKESKQRKEITSYKKFIFFGVGLGQHISSIHSKINAKIYLIVEDDLELFRLSLFCTNYSLLANDATLFFSLFDNSNEFHKVAHRFIEKKYFYNNYIKYFQLLSHSEEKSDEFYLTLTNQPHLRYFFNDTLKTSIKPLENIVNGYKFLKKDIKFNTSDFKKTPFLLLASGPSLQYNIEWLKENKNNFIIVCASSSLLFLEKNSIKPDIILHSDPFEIGIKSFNCLNEIGFIKDSLCLFSASTSQNILDICVTKNIYMYEMGTNYVQNSFKAYSPCVGSIGYQILLLLDIKEIYLLGLDLAIDPINGMNHIDTHHDTKQLTAQKNKATLDYKESLFPVKGNLRKEVYTTPHFFNSLYTINNYFTNLKDSNQLVYNLGDGAKIKDTISIYPQNIKVKSFNKSDVINKIFNQFSLYAIKDSILIDKNILNNKLQEVKSVKKQLKSIEPAEIVNIDKYLQDIINICSLGNQEQNSELFKILDNFLHYISGYIYSYLDHKDTKISEFTFLHKLFMETIEEILDYYSKSLNKVLTQNKD